MKIRKNTFRRLALAVSMVGAVSALPADDWPQWRGPQRDATWRESGVSPTIPPQGLKILWRTRVGTGFSSPSVAAGRFYVTDSEVTRMSTRESAHCWEAATGNHLWTHTDNVVYPEYLGRKMTWSPPAFANRCVFARSDRELVCASLAVESVDGRRAAP